MSAQLVSRSLYAAGLCALLGAAACTDDSNPVAPSRSTAPRAAQRQITVSEPSLSLISIEVGAGQLKQPLLYDIPLSDGASAAVFSTPAAEGRSITVRGYDVYGNLTHQGSAKTSVIWEGKNEPLSVALYPVREGKEVSVSLDMVGEVAIGGGSIQLKAPKEMRQGQSVALNAAV